MMYLIVPLSDGVAVTLLQLGDPTLFVFCCKVKPVEDDGHEISAVFVAVRTMLNKGAPGICTTESRLQNPPVSE